MATILIVDDSKTSRKILRDIFEGEGHDIVGEAANGQEAVSLYDKTTPDLVTMDITMPDMDGLDALEAIMEMDQSAKVIMVSAAGQKNKMVEAVKLGASEFVTKPLDTEHILAVIRKVLSD